MNATSKACLSWRNRMGMSEAWSTSSKRYGWASYIYIFMSWSGYPALTLSRLFRIEERRTRQSETIYWAPSVRSTPKQGRAWEFLSIPTCRHSLTVRVRRCLHQRPWRQVHLNSTSSMHMMNVALRAKSSQGSWRLYFLLYTLLNNWIASILNRNTAKQQKWGA